MKKITSFLLVLFISFIFIPTIEAEGNYYKVRIYNITSYSTTSDIDRYASDFFIYKGISTVVNNGDGTGSFYYGDKLMETYRVENGDTIYEMADGLTYKDNVKYTFTDEDLRYFDDNGIFFYKGYDGIIFVFAEECEDGDICILTTTLENKSEYASINNDPVIEGLTASFDVSLKNVNDYVKYKITIQNKTTEEYKLNVKDFKKSDYIKYTYTFDDNTSIIKPESNKVVYVTIKYDKEVPATELENGFKEINKVVFTTDEDVSNPKTGELNLMVVLAIGVVLMAACYILVDKKQTRFTLSALLLLLLTPLTIKAVTELTITVNTAVEIQNGSVIMSVPYEGSPKSSDTSDRLGGYRAASRETFWKLKKSIITVTFSNKIVEPETYAYKYDVSEKEDNSVIAYLVVNEQDNSLYDLYIMCDGYTYANPNSKGMFENFESLESINGMEYFNTSKVTTMEQMFYNCKSLVSIDLSHFNTSKVTNMEGLFSHCSSLTALDLSHFDTSKVTKMLYFFSGCSELTTLDLSNFDTSKVTNMSNMFYNCSNMTTINISSFDTSKVTDMSGMFGNCSNLTTLDLSHFNTSEVKSMGSMFRECYKLTTLDISNFDTSKVGYMALMFYDCSSLTELDLSHFNTGNTTNMYGMFERCRSLISLNISNFDTSKVNDMTSMFENCSSLITLDLSSFTFDAVTKAQLMFNFCNKLTTIYGNSSINFSSILESTGMFAYCNSLVGGNGTTFNSSNVDVTYARIDTPETPGYFTLK